MTEHERIKILLVEDEKIDRMALERHVDRKKLPYDLVCVGSKAAAVDMLQKERFDILLMDYRLPDGTAFDLLEYADRTPVIFVTGSGSEEIAAEAMRKGAYDYVIKDPEQHYLTVLPSTIDNVLERKRIEEEKDRLIRELQEAVEEIKTLSGLLPICARCKKIRDDQGYWQQIEQFIQEHSEAEFTHSLCPECSKKLYPDLYAEEKK